MLLVGCCVFPNLAIDSGLNESLGTRFSPCKQLADRWTKVYKTGGDPSGYDCGVLHHQWIKSTAGPGDRLTLVVRIPFKI